jgi:hypothetical protein
MEVILELKLSQEEAEQLGLENEKGISLATLKRVLAKEKMKKALDKSYDDAAKYGYADMSMEEINDLIKEAKEEYQRQHEKNNS